MITMSRTVVANTYGEAIEIFGKDMDQLKDSNWKLRSANAEPIVTNAKGEIVTWQWELEGEWT